MPVHAASLADLANLVLLSSAYLDFYEVPASEEQVRAFFAKRLRQGDSTLFLTRDVEARALGFVQLYPLLASLTLQSSWLLSDPCVRPKARRRGVDEALMSQARGFVESVGVCGLQLETAKTNHAGQSLYERLGYVRDEQSYTYWLQL